MLRAKLRRFELGLDEQFERLRKDLVSSIQLQVSQEVEEMKAFLQKRTQQNLTLTELLDLQTVPQVDPFSEAAEAPADDTDMPVPAPCAVQHPDRYTPDNDET